MIVVKILLIIPGVIGVILGILSVWGVFLLAEHPKPKEGGI